MTNRIGIDLAKLNSLTKYLHFPFSSFSLLFVPYVLIRIALL